MDEEVLDLTPEEQAAAAAAAKPDPRDAEIERLKAENREKDEAARFWHGQAKGREASPAKPEPAAAEAVDETDLLDLITTQGPKGLKDWIGKQGYVSKEQVAATVESRAEQLTREVTLVREFPELADNDSDFFKQTAVEYGALVKQGVPSTVAMGVAARLVNARSEAPGAPGQTKEQKEAARVARIKAQGGDKGRRGAPAEADEALNSDQETVLAGMGVTKEQFAASKKELGTAARRRG